MRDVGRGWDDGSCPFNLKGVTLEEIQTSILSVFLRRFGNEHLPHPGHVRLVLFARDDRAGEPAVHEVLAEEFLLGAGHVGFGGLGRKDGLGVFPGGRRETVAGGKHGEGERDDVLAAVG